MAVDNHFDTGEYDPRAYWDARAEHCGGELYQAVCGYGLSAERNLTMDRMQRHLLARCLGRSLDGCDVLDFGCGAGRLAGWFQERGAGYSGVDLSSEMLALARRQYPDADFHRLDAAALPFPAERFDVAVSVTVLHHNPYETQRTLIAELLRVLRPGGLLLLLERTGPHRDAETLFTMFPRPRDEWIAEATACGATLERSLPARWWILPDTAGALLRRLAPRRAGDLDPAVTRWPGRLDPWLAPLLPWRRATAAALLFRKVPRQPRSSPTVPQ